MGPTAAGDPFAPRDGAGLAFVRAAFGAVMLGDVLRTFLRGRIEHHWLEPAFHFTYYGFSWVRPYPPAGMSALFVGLGLASALLALGLFTRLAAAAFALGFANVFLMEKARYLNHHWLILLVACLLAVVPAGNALSLDARRRGGERAVPAWSLALLRAQVGLVYLFAGIAKLNADWLHARPLVDWLPRRADRPLIGPLLAHEATAWVFSYGGLLLDLLAWPLLARRATRHATFLVLVAFHLANAAIFDIGVFPWTMLALTTVFFEPDWPRRLLPARLRGRRAAALGKPSRARRRLVLGFVGLWLLVQVALPLRHLLYPGSVHWSEEGHRFSWHMKLRDKEGRAAFLVRDPATGEEWLVDPAAELEDWQVSKMAGRPDMVHEYALHLARTFRPGGPGTPHPPGLRVYATVRCSLNGGPEAPLVDPTVDLAAEPRGLGHARWILPAP